MRSRLSLGSGDKFKHAILYQVVRTDVKKDELQVWEAQIAHDPKVDNVVPSGQILMPPSRPY
jgi:hypothetical protein